MIWLLKGRIPAKARHVSGADSGSKRARKLSEPTVIDSSSISSPQPPSSTRPDTTVCHALAAISSLGAALNIVAGVAPAFRPAPANREPLRGSALPGGFAARTSAGAAIVGALAP